MYDQLIKSSDALFGQDEEAIQEQWWGDLILTFRRALGFTKRIASGGIEDLAINDFEDLESFVLAMVEKTGYRKETL
jgi:hypothetical protein